MPYNYNNIVHDFFEELKPLFVNYLHKSFTIGYDEINDIYSKVWLDVYQNIKRGKVEEGTKWKAYILKMGWNQAYKVANLRTDFISIDKKEFDRHDFENKYTQQVDDEPDIYRNPDLQAVLAAELSYIPDPCNKILRLFYYEGLSMKEIAISMNYSSERTAITTKKRCLDRLKERVKSGARLLGIIN